MSILDIATGTVTKSASPSVPPPHKLDQGDQWILVTIQGLRAVSKPAITIWAIVISLGWVSFRPALRIRF